MIDYHIREGVSVARDYTVHVCPSCGHRWLEESDNSGYPNYCPNCGEEYDI